MDAYQGKITFLDEQECIFKNYRQIIICYMDHYTPHIQYIKDIIHF